MDEPNKRNSANSALTKKHFAKFHERIHNKYVEIQRRMHKSKSVDSISCLSDDFPLQTSKHLSSCDVIKYEEKNTKKPVKYDIIEEDVNKNNVVFGDCYEVNNFSRPQVTITAAKSENSIYFGDDINSSFESLYAEELKEEKLKESTPNTLPSASPNSLPSPKISIKDKIGTKISAAKERRREVKEKKELKKKEALEGVDKFILSNTSKPKVDSSKKKNKMASVTVALVEATGLENETTTEEKSRLFFCKIRLGAEKRKSKTIKTSSTENVVSWQELFNIGLFEDNFFEISMWDKDVLIGKTVLDLSEVEREKTHRMRLNLDEGVGNVQIFFLLTISGATLVNTFADLDDYQESQNRFETLKKKYAWSYLNNNLSDIGWVSIILYGAKGLASSDTYCVVELENDRLQSHTEYKTSDPNWMKIMEFAVRDITSILVISVFDEKKSEVVGKVCIPLLRVENGLTKWYALKDNTLKERAKGNNPRILLEIKVYFNLIKASLRVVNPKETNYLETEQEFNRHVFGNNVTRAKAVVTWTLDAIKFLKTCFEWESRKSNTIALSTWVLFWWFYKPWMFPLLLLIPFALYRPRKYYLIKRFKKEEIVKVEEVEDKEEKNKSLMQKINSLQDTVQSVQNGIGKLAVFGETIKNLCNFTVPFLSIFAIFLILVASFVIYLIPFTYLLIGWGVHKFLRKILRPNRIPNNEILDLLSRVPDDETLNQCEELPLLEMTEDDEIN